MKSKFLVPIFLFFFNFLAAQEFAVIHDKDGYTNLRSENNKGSRIIDTLKNGHLIWVMSNEGNWLNIDYMSINNETRVGYIYNNRIKRISEYAEIPISKSRQNEIIFSDKTFEVVIVESKFDKNKHSFKYVNEYPNQILKIDGKDY